MNLVFIVIIMNFLKINLNKFFYIFNNFKVSKNIICGAIGFQTSVSPLIKILFLIKVYMVVLCMYSSFSSKYYVRSLSFYYDYKLCLVESIFEYKLDLVDVSKFDFLNKHLYILNKKCQ